MAATMILSQQLISGLQRGSAIAIPAGKTQIDVESLMSNSDASNPANSGTVSLLFSTDGGNNFSVASSANWVGGFRMDGITSAPPGLTGPIPPNATHATASIVFTGGLVLSCGLTIAFS